MSENLRRAQLLADTAYQWLMWNENGDGTTYTPRPITDRQRETVEALTALSRTYAEVAGAEAAEAMVDMHDRAMDMMATGRAANSDEREV